MTKMFCGLNLAVIAVLLSASAGPATAHHSFAMFNREKMMEVSGTVRTFQWTNPHAYIWLWVANKEGKQEVWGIELGGGPNMMLRAGWNKHTVNPGDKIKVRIHPLKDGRTGGMFVDMT